MHFGSISQYTTEKGKHISHTGYAGLSAEEILVLSQLQLLLWDQAYCALQTNESICTAAKGEKLKQHQVHIPCKHLTILAANEMFILSCQSLDLNTCSWIKATMRAFI